MTNPTGQEPTTAVDLRETSVTERIDFRTCRRRWFLNTVHRLEPAGGAPHFWFGNMIHYALEHYYLAGSPHLQETPTILPQSAREEYALEQYWAFFKQSMGEFKEQLGFLYETAYPEYREMADMGEGMLRGYFRMDVETGGWGKVVAIEERLRVPIRGPSGRALPKQYLTGRFDLVIQRKDGTYWVVDHKTAAQKHSSAHLDIDDQLTGYAYIFWQATGIFPEGQVYNVLLKKVPKAPRLLKAGRLSEAKDQNTTYSLYLEAIKQNGFNRADYQDMLDYLKDKGWGDFYIQEGVFRTRGQMASFERNLYREWRDMRMVAATPEAAYPNPSPITCPGCPVKKVCAVMQDGGDYEQIILNDYTIAPPRR